MTDLLPCPFCNYDQPRITSDGNGCAWVVCPSCYARSGGFEDFEMAEHLLEDHASREWNTRAPGWQSMAKRTRLKYTTRVERRGKVEWWFRRGSVWRLLPGDPGDSEEAAKLYWKLRSGEGLEDRSRSVSALIASELYEAGCSDAHVQAITGHKTAAMARKYGKGARQRVLAREARKR